MNDQRKKAGRPAVRDEPMSEAAFAAFTRLCALSPKREGYRAARMVLVEGRSREEAAQQIGVSRKTLQMTLWRYAKLRELARVVAG